MSETTITQGYELVESLLPVARRCIRATATDGYPIASARQQVAGHWIVIASTPTAPNVAAKFTGADDALEWLNYIARLYVRAVTA
ncbi:hypothetical protein ACAG26_24180 [Mycobacterium sp. pUA109]|uniref:hypothetical protein n=1 Tax=Mycobacterium sp. pUA109 TaxID=3238982 RepID=UPI00351B1BF4